MLLKLLFSSCAVHEVPPSSSDLQSLKNTIFFSGWLTVLVKIFAAWNKASASALQLEEI